MESFRKESRINPTLEFTDAMPCYYLLIAAVFGHIKKTCHFSPIRMLRSWAKALYCEGNAVLAGSPAFPMALHKLASLADSSLETLLIDFAHATTHKRLLSGYVQ